jgi:hypothetical protein
LLHEIFQRHGIPPREVYNAPDKRFMYGSMALVLEEEKRERTFMKMLNARGRK